MQDRFAAANTELLGLSIDSNPSHIEWTRRIGHYSWNGIEHPVLKFPIVADDMGNVARLYGMLMPSASTTRTVRNVFVIDPKGIVRAILIYPLTTGRNIDEIYRLVLALQAYDNTGDPTPADWEPGDSQILPAPTTFPMSNQRLEDQKNGAFSCLDWYLCLTKPAGEPAGTQAAQSSAAPSASSAAAPSMTSPADEHASRCAACTGHAGYAAGDNAGAEYKISGYKLFQPAVCRRNVRERSCGGFADVRNGAAYR